MDLKKLPLISIATSSRSEYTLESVYMGQTVFKILHVEDDPGHAKLIRDLLLDSKISRFQLTQVETLNHALRILKQNDFDAILLDLGLPDSHGIPTIHHIMVNVRELPIVALTASYDGTLGIEAMKAGAEDYLMKDQITAEALERSLIYAIERKRLDHLKNEFVNVVSHELRTPLTVVRQTLYLMKEELAGRINPEQENFLGITLRNIERLGNVVNNLLDIAKIEVGKTELKEESFDIVEAAQEVTILFGPKCDEKGLHIKVLPSHPKIELVADRDKIIQVLTNLVSNAMKFTHQGKIEVILQDRCDHVECTVSDTGKGIAKEDLHKVFRKFQQFDIQHITNEKGTGLGLAICKGLVELHRGKIWVDSDTHQGARFTFVLPKNQPHS